MRVEADLEDILTQGHSRVPVQQPGQEELHDDHHGGCEGHVRAGRHAGQRQLQPRDQGNRKAHQAHGAAIPEGMILLLQPDALIPLRAHQSVDRCSTTTLRVPRNNQVNTFTLQDSAGSGPVTLTSAMRTRRCFLTPRDSSISPCSSVASTSRWSILFDLQARNAHMHAA